MEKLKTIANFTNQTGAMPLVNSVVTAVPGFWSIFLFFLWIFATAGSYMLILKTTGKKRFWHVLVAMSFIVFLSSLLIVSMNTALVEHLNPYWVGFYIMMVLLSWLGLSNYK
jgi:hypothetical protein